MVSYHEESMPDVKLEVVKVHRTYLSYAQMISTMWPISGKRAYSEEHIRKHVNILQRNWRDTVVVLKDHGWDVFGNNPGGKLQFMRNCPPTLVSTANTSYMRLCNYNNICPFCHMRKIVQPYMTLEALVPERGGYADPRFKLVEISNSVKISKESAGDFIDGMLVQWTKSPHTLLKRYKPLGAIWRVSVDPRAVSEYESAYNLVYRVLAVVPVHHEVPGWITDNKRKVRVTAVKSRKQLINVLARHYRYPVGLMWGDPDMVVRCLHGMSSLICSGMQGCFRSNKQLDLDKINEKKDDNQQD